MLAEGGLSVPDGSVAVDVAGAVDVALGVGLPVALKLSSPALLHKTEAGALALDLRSEEDVRDAAERLLGLPAAAGATLLVERMAGDGVELIFAVRRDGVVPALLIGRRGDLGGGARRRRPCPPPRLARAGRAGAAGAARRFAPDRRSRRPGRRPRRRRPLRLAPRRARTGARPRPARGQPRPRLPHRLRRPRRRRDPPHPRLMGRKALYIRAFRPIDTEG